MEKIWTVFLTASTSISINFPVLDETIAHFFSSAFGTNSFALSSQQNNPILQHNTRKKRKEKKRSEISVSYKKRTILDFFLFTLAFHEHLLVELLLYLLLLPQLNH